MKKLAAVVIMILIPMLLGAQEVVERIEIIGNNRVTDETIMYYISSREGDYFSRDLLLNDFKTLWSTGFFSNIRIEEEEAESGWIIKIIVEENPMIKSILYKTGKKVKEDDIVNKLKENDEYILPYSYYSPYKIQKIKEIILDMLKEKGLPDGKVDIETKEVGDQEVELAFKINEGQTIRVGEVVFEGDPKLRDSRLLEAFKNNKEHNFISWIGGKDSFNRGSLNEDLQNLRSKLQENGYMEAVIGEPRIEDITKRSFLVRSQTMKKIIIPVDAGYRYFVGDIKIEGNKMFSEKNLRTLVPLQEGDIYNAKEREKGVQEIDELYRNFGYLYARIIPTETLDPKNKRVNVNISIIEGDLTYLSRLVFKGNNFTKDKVIRREMLIREGYPFSIGRFRDSILRVKQLGLVEMEKDPDIKPDPEDPTKINVDMYVKETQRNNIQFTAGYSGYEGTFLSLSYSTVNFLGAGEKLELTFQHGKRVKNYQFGFTEPYFLDLPLSFGLNLFNSMTIMPYLYTRKGKGANFTVSARVKGYWTASLTYGYELVSIKMFDEDDYADWDDYYSYYAYYASYYQYYGYAQNVDYAVSSITPTIYRSTVDSPLTPTRGTLMLASCKFAGGFLGGEIDMIKPRLELAHYQPIISNHVLGLHLEYQNLLKMGDSAIPYWERSYLGGERSIRGYDIYTIGPRSEEGYNLGGDKSLVINTEYIIPVGGPLYAILFFDAGNAWDSGQKINLKDIYTSSGLELRIFVPALRVPFRLIFSYNNRLVRDTDSNFAFRFAIGTTF